MREHLLPDVDPIREAHLSERSLLVIDVAGFDDDTVFAFQATIARSLGIAIAERTTRDADQPGVRLRMYTDLRQALEEATSPERAPPPSETPSVITVEFGVRIQRRVWSGLDGRGPYPSQ